MAGVSYRYLRFFTEVLAVRYTPHDDGGAVRALEGGVFHRKKVPESFCYYSLSSRDELEKKKSLETRIMIRGIACMHGTGVFIVFLRNLKLERPCPFSDARCNGVDP